MVCQYKENYARRSVGQDILKSSKAMKNRFFQKSDSEQRQIYRLYRCCTYKDYCQL